MELKTSEDWSKLCEVVIYDPDGWDRSPDKFQYSWFEELISREEFEKRMLHSTVIMNKPVFDEKGNVNSIWKDLQ